MPLMRNSSFCSSDRKKIQRAHEVLVRTQRGIQADKQGNGGRAEACHRRIPRITHRGGAAKKDKYFSQRGFSGTIHGRKNNPWKQDKGHGNPQRSSCPSSVWRAFNEIRTCAGSQ